MIIEILASIAALVFAQLVLLPVANWLLERRLYGARAASLATIWRDGQVWLPRRS